MKCCWLLPGGGKHTVEMIWTRSLQDSWLDLFGGSSCLRCERPGSMACDRCLSELPGSPRPVKPSPTPVGLVDCFSVLNMAP